MGAMFTEGPSPKVSMHCIVAASPITPVLGVCGGVHAVSMALPSEHSRRTKTHLSSGSAHGCVVVLLRRQALKRLECQLSNGNGR